jgi:hypothetical protein
MKPEAPRHLDEKTSRNITVQHLAGQCVSEFSADLMLSKSFALSPIQPNNCSQRCYNKQGDLARQHDPTSAAVITALLLCQAPSARDQGHCDKTKPITHSGSIISIALLRLIVTLYGIGHSTGTQGTCRGILHDLPEHSARDYVHSS